MVGDFWASWEKKKKQQIIGGGLLSWAFMLISPNTGQGREIGFPPVPGGCGSLGFAPGQVLRLRQGCSPGPLPNSRSGSCTGAWCSPFAVDTSIYSGDETFGWDLLWTEYWANFLTVGKNLQVVWYIRLKDFNWGGWHFSSSAHTAKEGSAHSHSSFNHIGLPSPFTFISFY